MELIDFRMPAGGFAQPLLLWSACHQRSQRVALLLQRLVAHLQAHGPSDATRVTAEEIARYMQQAAPRHHADEDEDLFPRLLQRLQQARGAPDAAQAEMALAAIERLGRDHGDLDAQWAEVHASLARGQAPAAREAERALRFVDSFLAHHEVEERLIAPVAARVLRADDLAQIGEAMAARRGTTWAALSVPAAGRA